jgi:protein tyrosine/serine phosphatase
MRYFTLVCLFFSGCQLVELDKGKFYRSPQPSRKDLERAITFLKIKTVINLRGANPGEIWYDEEKAVTDFRGVKLIDIPMSAGRLPHRKDLLALLDAYQTAERPILVHCQAGVDRTGEASAIYAMLYLGISKDLALEMLTPQFGYIEEISAARAKMYFIRDLWQGEEWARTQYDPCKQNYRYYDKNNYAECK